MSNTENETAALGGLSIAPTTKTASGAAKMQIPFNRTKVEGEWSDDADDIALMRGLYGKFAKVNPAQVDFGPTEAKRTIKLLVRYAAKQLSVK